MPNSLRIRLSPRELDLLASGRAVEQRLGPKDGWSVSLAPSKATSLTIDGARVLIGLCAKDIQRLCEPATEGVYFEAAHESTIRYFIEKDFPCLHPRPHETGEPETESFPAPPGFKKRHKG
jgi:hypothetical protein